MKDEKNDTWSEIKPTSSNPSASNKCKKLKNENNVELKEMKPDVSENITRKLPDENTSNFNSKDVEKNDNKNSRKEFQKSNENDTYEFDPCDTVKTSDSLNEKLESLNKNTNQYLSNIIVLAKKKKQTPSSVPVDSAQITSDKPNEQKNQKSNPTFIHCSKPEKTGNSENSENTNKENQTPFDLGPKKESDIKRQFIELSLGEITSDIKLDPNEGLNGGKKRLAEFKTLKEIPKKILLEKAKGILRKTSVLKQEDVSRNVKLINLGAPKVDGL